MKLSEIMTHEVHCASPMASLQDAARMMKEHDVGSLPVCDNDQLTGMVTDRDLVVRGLANGQAADATVSDVMSPRVTWSYDDQEVEAAAEIMRAQRIRRLPVLNHDKRLVGIVSLGDLAVRAQDERLSSQTLEAVSEPV